MSKTKKSSKTEQTIEPTDEPPKSSKSSTSSTKDNVEKEASTDASGKSVLEETFLQKKDAPPDDGSSSPSSSGSSSSDSSSSDDDDDDSNSKENSAVSSPAKKKSTKSKKGTSTSSPKTPDERQYSSAITSSNFFDPTSKIGHANIQSASMAPAQWNFPTVSPENRGEYMALLASLADKWGLPILSVPTSGDGKPASKPKTLAGTRHANINFDKFVSIIDLTVTTPPMDTVVAYAHWIQGGTYKLMKDTSTDTMVSIAVDPNLRGNEGLVNRKKIALRRQSAVIYQFLLNVIPLKCFTQFRIHEKKYKYQDEADPTTTQCCGLTLLAMLLSVLKPSSKVDVGHLENLLEKVTFEGCKFNFVAYSTKITDLLMKIMAERGVEYDDNRLMTRFFKQLQDHKNKEWEIAVYGAKNAWKSGKSKLADVISELTIVYNDLLTTGDWGKIDDQHKQVIALSTQLNQVSSQLKKTEAKLDKQRIPRKSKNSDKPAGKLVPQKKTGGAPSWQITKKGEEILHPDTNAKMVWCPHHKSSDGVVNGMYMTAPHDHDAWKAAKDQKIADRKAKRKAEREAEGDKPSKKSGTDNNKVSRLALSKSLLTGLATQYEISGPDAQQFVESTLDEAAQSKE